ncbi:hypothetical protein [Alienimonas chondri]|uniref:Uncharacterized protein n=1 Tax=Alienimonas chondri TaxID=2681879 RepID=A0ABX1VH22_9PLAN|nr:hypothetical protein [Alienimonas chondri]NNJ27094.1 hypothetical protein [Alienimonas chondri]
MDSAPDRQDLSPAARFKNAVSAAIMAAVGLAGLAFVAILIFWWVEYFRGQAPQGWEAGTPLFWIVVAFSVLGFAVPPIAFWRVYRRLWPQQN